MPNFELIEGDIRGLSTCEEAVAGMDYVLHQAALGSVPRSIKDPITTNATNIGGHLNMLVAVKNSNTVKRMIYAASSSTYGDSKILPKKEEVIGKPLSPYAVTKYVNELYADVFAKTYGVDTIGLRYFNVFGPKQDPNGAYAAVIPLFMKAVLDNKSPTINGDGLQTRDFTYIENAVQANIKAMLASEEAGNKVYNVAVGDRTTLLDVWNIIKEISKSDINPNFGENRAGDIRDSLADITRAQENLKYNDLVKLTEGLKTTYEWYKLTPQNV